MRTMAADFLIPLCTALIAAATAAELTKKTAPANLPGRFAERILGKCKGNRLAFTLIGITAALQIVLYLIADALVSHFTVKGSTGISWIAMLLCSLLGFAALIVTRYTKKERLNRFLSRTAAAGAALLLLECFFFGAKSLTANPKSGNVQQITLGSNAEFTDDPETELLLNSERAEVELTLSEDARAVTIAMEKKDVNRMIQVTADIKDENFSRVYKQADRRYVAGNGEAFSLNFDPYGKLYSVRLVFENIGDQIAVYHITESTAQPFRFMVLRYLLLMMIVTAVLAIRCFALHRVTYDRTKYSHRIVLAVITCCCICAPLLLYSHQELIEYDPEYGAGGEDIFVQTFDALMHGQTALRMEASEGLKGLSESEVYDNSVREEEGIYYAWDHAYKDGKYYSYFGITPLVTLYYPTYWLTHKLPTLRWAIMFFSLFTAAFTCMAVISGVELLVKKPNFLMLCLSLPASVFAVGIFYTLQSYGMYVLPVISAICFLMLTLWQGFAACREQKKIWKNYVHFGISGLALGLCAGCRPSVAISAAVLIPLFLGVVLNREAKWKEKLLKAGIFAVPLFAVVIGLLIYNNARFGSYTDFGATYQLTVSNVNANGLRLYAIPDGIYHYMLQPPEFNGSFPFIKLSWQGLQNYERYRFTYSNIGVLWIPMFAAALILLRTACTGSCAETPQKAVTALQKKAVLLTGFAVACIVGWMDFCLAGNGLQYIFDLAPILCVCGAIVLVTAAEQTDGLRYRLSAISCAATVLTVVLLLIGNREGAIHENYPLLYQNAESMFVFWH